MCKIEDCFLIEAGYWLDKEKSIFKRNDFLPATLIRSVIEKRKNIGVFQTTFRYNTENQDEAILYGDFYLDFDSDNFEKARKDALKSVSYFKIVFNLPDVENHMKIYFSGNKGFHIIVPAVVLDIKPCKNLNEIFKTLALAISSHVDNDTVDLRIYDNKRLFRIPNSKHEKSGLHKVEITLSELKYYTERDIKSIAESNRILKDRTFRESTSASKMFKTFIDRTEIRLKDFKNIKSKGNLRYTPPCISTILQEGAVSGQRNDTIAVLASFFKSTGKDLKDTTEVLLEWNNEVNSDPTPEAELKKTTRSIYNTEKTYGCSRIKELGICSEKDCKFKK